MSKIHPIPDGPWPAGMAWFPLLGQFMPSSGLNFIPDDWDPSWEEPEPEPLAPDHWRTMKGQIIRICDLETAHLRNIILLIERKNGGKGCLVRLSRKSERVRNLLNEWLKRF